MNADSCIAVSGPYGDELQKARVAPGYPLEFRIRKEKQGLFWYEEWTVSAIVEDLEGGKVRVRGMASFIVPYIVPEEVFGIVWGEYKARAYAKPLECRGVEIILSLTDDEGSARYIEPEDIVDHGQQLVLPNLAMDERSHPLSVDG